MRRKISQREAHALLKEVRELREREGALLSAWGREYYGVYLVSLELSDYGKGLAEATRGLGHIMVARYSDNQLRIYAMPRGRND